MDLIGVGVLSFAHGHAVTYCDVLQSNSGARLVAAWDDNGARGAENAARFGMDFYDSPAAVLARDDVDAVIIACETNRHAELILAACAAGKDVLCQKPMATTLEDCDRIIAAVESSGVHFQMAFQMRCDPLNRQIKNWIDEGAIGKIGAIRRRHCIDVLFNETFVQSAGAWHFDALKNIGMFFDDAVHATDFLYWMMGKPVSVMAEIENTLTNVAPDDCGLAIYKWQNENRITLGALFNSSVALAGENTCEVYGDEGVIIQNFDDLVSTMHANGVPALKLYRRATQSWEYSPLEVPARHGARIGAVAGDWIETLQSRSAPTVSARDGKVSVEMCLAAYRSAATGQRISL
jgi:predicted dehydrogenase